MVDLVTPRYKGDVRPVDSRSDDYLPYLPSKELKDAVNLTILLETRPLLIKGEPGSGKTQLARAVASELGLDFYFWPIKSTSRARDGLYTYDAVRRLQEAQLNSRDEQGQLRADDIYNYIDYGPLGKAFISSNEKRSVVLIDEIDKADIDFPNDLLLELDEQWFEIEETRNRDHIKANKPPIVFITSNDEKDLPDAFLRRCLFYYIKFPDPDQLTAIVNAHFPHSSKTLVQKAIKRFMQLREQMGEKKTGKKVSTSELIDWFRILSSYPKDEVLAQLQGQLPYPAALLKSWEDFVKYYVQDIPKRTT